MLILFGLLLVIAYAQSALCQHPTVASDLPLEYENHNQIDYGPLRIRKVSGVVKDPSDVAIPGASILLFTERDHKLITHGKTKENGTFNLGDIGGGKYRVVVKYYGFCSANVPVDLKSKGHSRHGLIIHMTPGAIDTCSYGAVQ